jgi:hypothetical protein
MYALAKQSPFIAACSPCYFVLYSTVNDGLGKHTRAASAAGFESSSVLAMRQKGQEFAEVGYRADPYFAAGGGGGFSLVGGTIPLSRM